MSTSENAAEIPKKIKEIIDESRKLVDSKSSLIYAILKSLKEENEVLIGKLQKVLENYNVKCDHSRNSSSTNISSNIRKKSDLSPSPNKAIINLENIQEKKDNNNKSSSLKSSNTNKYVRHISGGMNNSKIKSCLRNPNRKNTDITNKSKKNVYALKFLDVIDKKPNHIEYNHIDSKKSKSGTSLVKVNSMNTPKIVNKGMLEGNVKNMSPKKHYVSSMSPKNAYKKTKYKNKTKPNYNKNGNNKAIKFLVFPGIVTRNKNSFHKKEYKLNKTEDKEKDEKSDKSEFLNDITPKNSLPQNSTTFLNISSQEIQESRGIKNIKKVNNVIISSCLISNKEKALFILIKSNMISLSQKLLISHIGKISEEYGKNDIVKDHISFLEDKLIKTENDLVELNESISQQFKPSKTAEMTMTFITSEDEEILKNFKYSNYYNNNKYIEFLAIFFDIFGIILGVKLEENLNKKIDNLIKFVNKNGKKLKDCLYEFFYSKTNGVIISKENQQKIYELISNINKDEFLCRNNEILNQIRFISFVSYTIFELLNFVEIQMNIPNGKKIVQNKIDILYEDIEKINKKLTSNKNVNDK